VEGPRIELKKFLSKTLHQSNRKIGLATFAPDPKNLNHVVRRLSPLSYSAMGGNPDAVNLFQKERYAVNLAEKEVRHDHPLYWPS
jgi:hypothetical protein